MPVLRVFRDKTSLAASSGVWSAIEENLAQCRWFILLASPPAAQSVWVGKEVAWWLANRDIAQLLLVTTDGELFWDNARSDFDISRSTCLPPGLQGRFREEPNFVDLRWARSRDELTLRHTRFRATILDLAAPVHGCPKDHLDSDDIRQQRRTRLVSTFAVSTIAALGIGAALAAWIAIRNADEARRNETIALSRASAAEAQLAIREGRLKKAFEDALTAWSTSQTQEARSVLFEAWQASLPVQRWVEGFDPIEAVFWAANGKSVWVWQRTGRLSEWSFEHRRVVSESRLPVSGPPTASAFSTDGKRLAVGDGRGMVTVYEVASGETVAKLPSSDENPVLSLAFDPSRPLLAVGHQLAPGGLVLWDLSQRAPSLPQPNFDNTDFDVAFIADLAFSPEGKLLAGASGMPGSATGVWLIPSGTLLERVSGSGSSTMHTAVLIIHTDDGGRPGSRVVLGWSTGETSLHALSGAPPEQSRHPRHEERVTRLAELRLGLASTGDDGLVNVTSGAGEDSERRLPGWARAANRAMAVDPEGDHVAVGGSDGTLLVYELTPPPPDPNFRPSLERLSSGRLLVSRLGASRGNEQGAKASNWLADGITGAPLVEAREGRRLATSTERWCAVYGTDNRLALLDTRAKTPQWRSIELPAGMRPYAVEIQRDTVLIRAYAPGSPAIARLDRPQEPARPLQLAQPAFGRACRTGRYDVDCSNRARDRTR